MDEAEFLDLADETLADIEERLGRLVEEADVDIDIEPQAGGILKLEFGNGSQIIINRHAAAREIWVAARAGGFHFRHDGGRWIGTRDGRELLAVLEELASAQAGAPLSLGD